MHSLYLFLDLESLVFVDFERESEVWWFGLVWGGVCMRDITWVLLMNIITIISIDLSTRAVGGSKIS